MAHDSQNFCLLGSKPPLDPVQNGWNNTGWGGCTDREVFWVPNHGVWILMSWVQMNLSPVECELAKEWRSQLHYLKQMVFKLLEGMFSSSPHA